jgi:hypothetical protein
MGSNSERRRATHGGSIGIGSSAQQDLDNTPVLSEDYLVVFWLETKKQTTGGRCQTFRE